MQSGSMVSLGIGFYLTQDHRPLHHSQGRLDSVPGQGSTFCFTVRSRASWTKQPRRERGACRSRGRGRGAPLGEVSTAPIEEHGASPTL